jgi:hypothetical protein
MLRLEFSNPFDAEGNWYKANLHAHSTQSDGKLPPDGLARWYRNYGYDILALTDHGKVTDPQNVQEPDILCLPGAELDVGRAQSGSSYHVVALGISDASGFAREMSLTEAVSRVRDLGGLAYLAHPYWSCLCAPDVAEVQGLLGVEVYNHGCELEIAKGFSSVHWDDLLLRGERLTAIGVDDCHRAGWDFFGGWTMIRAMELTPEAVLEALRRGHCYATMGPVIHDLRVADGYVTVECSDAASIHFVGNHQTGDCVHADHRPPLRGAKYRLSGRERYVRVEIVGPTGLRAWSQPFFLTPE